MKDREEEDARYLLTIFCLPNISLDDSPANLTLIMRTCLCKVGLVSLKSILKQIIRLGHFFPIRDPVDKMMSYSLIAFIAFYLNLIL